PVPERTAFDPEVEAELGRRARAAYDRELAEGRRSPGESFTSGLKVPPSSWKVPAGTTETRWTGVLMDLETVDADRELCARSSADQSPDAALDRGAGVRFARRGELSPGAAHAPPTITSS